MDSAKSKGYGRAVCIDALVHVVVEVWRTVGLSWNSMMCVHPLPFRLRCPVRMCTLRGAPTPIGCMAILHAIPWLHGCGLYYCMFHGWWDALLLATIIPDLGPQTVLKDSRKMDRQRGLMKGSGAGGWSSKVCERKPTEFCGIRKTDVFRAKEFDLLGRRPLETKATVRAAGVGVAVATRERTPELDHLERPVWD